jgi:hypothetical protein
MPVISGVKTDAITIGKSTTDSQNFQLSANNDGTAKLARGSDGSLGDILTVASDGKVTLASGETLTSSKLSIGSEVTCAGQTSIPFTSVIPSWAKRITVSLNSVSTSGTSNFLIRLGVGGVLETTGYSSVATSIANAAVNNTTGFLGSYSGSSANTHGAIYTITKIGTGNTYVFAGVCGTNNAASNSFTCTGSKTLAGVLDSLSVTTVNGTDTFDTTPSAGSINIMWE